MAYSGESNPQRVNKDFFRTTLKLAAAQICQSLGWHSVQRSSHDILTDVLERYLKEVVKTAANHTNHYCRTVPNLDDVSYTFDHLGITLHELEDYVTQIDANPSSTNPPVLPVSACPAMLSFDVENQYPSIISTTNVEEVHPTHSVIEEYNIEDQKDHVLTAIPSDDVVIRKNSVESPPYSPLEPKSLNLDALVDMEVTRPGLVVTVPKGYTPTFSEVQPTIHINDTPRSTTNNKPSPLLTPEVIPKTEDVIKTNQSVIKQTHKDKTPEKLVPSNKSSKKVKTSKKAQKTSLSKPSTVKPAKVKTEILSPVKQKSKLIKVNSPIAMLNVSADKKMANDGKSSDTHESKKSESIEEKSTPSPKKVIGLDLANISDSVKNDEKSPVTLSSKLTHAEDPVVKLEPMDYELDENRLSPDTSKYPTDDYTLETGLSSPPDTLNNLLSPTIRRAGYSSDAVKRSVSPLKPSVAVNEEKKYSASSIEDICKSTVEVKIENIFELQNEVKSSPSDTVPFSLTVSSPTRQHSQKVEEKKKKKKKNKDRDKSLLQEERRDKKEKKKKHKETKERNESNESLEADSASMLKFTLPKLTLKMGGETLQSSPANTSEKTEVASTSKSFETLEPSMKKLKKIKKEENAKAEVKSKTGGFYVETLTNTTEKGTSQDVDVKNQSAPAEDVYYCPSCNRPDDGSPMIGCDSCDLWYHWPCVGIVSAPADDDQWFCPKCEPPVKKKKKKKKRDS